MKRLPAQVISLGMRARAWGPLAVLLSTPLFLASGGPGALVPAILSAMVAMGLTLPLVDMMRIRGRARPGSLVDGADARRPWLVALAGALLLLTLRLPALDDVEAPGQGPLRCAVSLAVAALLLVDVRALWRLRRGLSRPEALRPCTPASPPPDRRTLIVDFGLGDEAREELAPSPAVYRERERVLRLVRGSLPAARDALMRGIVFDLAVLVPSLAAIFAWLVAGPGLK